MLNWNTDTALFKSADPKEYTVWKLAQQINYGLLGGEKISLRDLKMFKKEVLLCVDDEGAALIEFLVC